MRGFLRPALRLRANDVQRAFGALSRHRRTKLARAAQTTLVKAHQWSRGGVVAPEIARALEGAVKALAAKAPKPA
ncbi:MAG: hypothetical protein ACLP1X_00435 [Polyangiaceae bacterium]|jgi:hypothetical protein